MKIKSFSELNSIDYNIDRIFAINQMWNKKSHFKATVSRPTNALLLFIGTDADFTPQGSKTPIKIKSRDLFFLPQNSKYSWNFYNTSQTSVSTMLFEFVLTDFRGERIELDIDAGCIDIFAFELYKDLFTDLIHEFSKPAFSPARARAKAYMLFAALGDEGLRRTSKFSLISKAISYLEQDPYQTRGISELADMCNVSVNYLEKLFKEYSGLTPNEYRLQKKIAKAKQLLSNGTLTIAEVSDNLNFDDVAYFCKIFKKKCGLTPTQYRNKKTAVYK